jgi:hypothetical protein
MPTPVPPPVTPVSPLSPLVDELDHLATVEHALCVLYLWFHCALGDVLEPGPAGGRADGLAMDQMRRIRGTNRALVGAGGTATVGRATHVRSDTGPGVELPALRPDALDTFLDRARAAAEAVDSRYGHLRGLAANADPPLAPEARDAVDAAADAGMTHAADLAGLRDALAGLTPDRYIRVRPAAEPEPGSIDADLLGLGDLYYSTTVEAVRLGMAHEDELIGLVQSTVSTMGELQGIHQRLAERGLLPRFGLVGS